MKHTITALVENRPGVLARLIGLISGRGYNIASLNVGPTQDSTCSRITMVVQGDDHALEQVTLQLAKQVDVLRVEDVTALNFISREMILVEVSTKKGGRSAILQLALLFSATVAAVQKDTIILQKTGNQNQIADFVRALREFDVVDISRSGVIAVARDPVDEE